MRLAQLDCRDHYLELIERYQPDYLWNDIGYPTEGSMLEVCAAHYNANADGLVNDRWLAARDLLAGSDDDRAAMAHYARCKWSD